VVWLALLVASVLDLSGSVYHAVMGVALAWLVLAWWLFGRLWSSRTPRARAGFWVVLVGLALAAIGAPFEAGGAFVLGVFLMLVGGPTAAVGLRRSGLPLWALALVCFVGFGVLCGDLFMDAPLLAAAGGIGLFGAGWIALGTLLWRRPFPYAFSSTPT
jgi:hypothetical protein